MTDKADNPLQAHEGEIVEASKPIVSDAILLSTIEKDYSKSKVTEEPLRNQNNGLNGRKTSGHDVKAIACV